MKNKNMAIRKTGEHLFVECGGVPRCGTCGCDEDAAFVGNEKCTFRATKKSKDKQRVVVLVENGMVMQILTSDPKIDVIVIDQDIQDEDTKKKVEKQMKSLDLSSSDWYSHID